MTDQTTQPLLEDEDGAPYPEDVQAIVRECVDLRAEVERLRLSIGASRCHADRDGDCSWAHCPQLRDGEPVKSGRHCPIDDEAQNTPVSTPSGPSAGLEGQGATQETQDATEAAQRRVERYAEEIRDALHNGWMTLPKQVFDLVIDAAIAVADQEQAELRAEVANLQTESAGWQDAAGSANDRAEAAEARVAEKDATIAELRAEVERLRKPTVAAVMGYELGAGDLERAEARMAELEATVAKVRAMLDAEDARVAEINDRHEAEGDISPKTGRPYKVVSIVTTRSLRAILDAPKDTTAP